MEHRPLTDPCNDAGRTAISVKRIRSFALWIAWRCGERGFNGRSHGTKGLNVRNFRITRTRFLNQDTGRSNWNEVTSARYPLFRDKRLRLRNNSYLSTKVLKGILIANAVEAVRLQKTLGREADSFAGASE